MAKYIQLPTTSTFRNIPWQIAILNVPVKEIAQRGGYNLYQWDEDGMGVVSGFGVVLPTGLWVVLREYENLIERGVCSGPTVEINSIPCNEMEKLLQEVLTAFELTDADVQTKRVGKTNDWT